MYEIESKFLVSSDMMRWVEKYPYEVRKEEKFYLHIDEKEVVYCQKCDAGRYSKVVAASQAKPQEEAIDKERYLAYKKQRVGKVLSKRCYEIQCHDGRFEVWVYGKKLEGIYLLKASFDDEKQMRSSETLESLDAFVLKKIDKDRKYDEVNLARFVKPMEYDLNKMYEKIDAFESANLFFWQVPSRLYVRDGVSLILYKNLRLIHYYKVNYQRKHFAATLHRLRVLLRRTATIMQSFAAFYNPNVVRFSRELLLRYHDETKVLRYLYFLEELCSTKKEAQMRLYSELTTLIEQEERAVVQMFLSQPFNQLVQIITRELYDEEYAQYKPLKKEVKKVIRAKLKAFKQLLTRTKEGYDKALLDELYTAMDDLQTLIEDFYHIIGEERTKPLVEEITILLKPLREYRNCEERASILDAIKEHSENPHLEVATLLCEHQRQLQEKIAHALKLLRGSGFDYI